MGFRFRKRIKIFPGLSFNLGKTGISTSIGGKGLTVNFKDGKIKTTVGLPGTGLSYSETSTSATDGTAPSNTPDTVPKPIIPAWVIWLIAVIVALWFLGR